MKSKTKKETYIKLLDLFIKDMVSGDFKNEAENTFISFYEKYKCNSNFIDALNERQFLKSIIDRKNTKEILENF